MIEIEYTIHLKSPLRIATGVGQAGGVDNTVVRHGARYALVPGSSVKGKVRAMAMRLADGLGIQTHAAADDAVGCLVGTAPCVICRIFGSAQWPGALYFDDATLHPMYQEVLAELDRQAASGAGQVGAAERYGRQVRTTTAMNRRQRIALDKHLFTQEVVEVPAFYGRISGNMRPTAGDGTGGFREEIALLMAALNMVTHLGGARGRGLGRCEIEITEAKVQNEAITLTELADYLAPSEGVQNDTD